MKNRIYPIIHMIHNKGRMSAVDFRKKVLEIAIKYNYEFDGDLVLVRKGSKIAKYYVNVVHNAVEYCGIYHLKKFLI